MSDFNEIKFVEEHPTYTIEDVERIASEAYQQGRADAIDEFIDKFKQNYKDEEWLEYVEHNAIPYAIWLAEQIKEQKNE